MYDMYTTALSVIVEKIKKTFFYIQKSVKNWIFNIFDSMVALYTTQGFQKYQTGLKEWQHAYNYILHSDIYKQKSQFFHCQFSRKFKNN